MWSLVDCEYDISELFQIIIVVDLCKNYLKI